MSLRPLGVAGRDARTKAEACGDGKRFALVLRAGEEARRREEETRGIWSSGPLPSLSSIKSLLEARLSRKRKDFGIEDFDGLAMFKLALSILNRPFEEMPGACEDMEKLLSVNKALSKFMNTPDFYAVLLFLMGYDDEKRREVNANIRNISLFLPRFFTSKDFFRAWCNAHTTKKVGLPYFPENTTVWYGPDNALQPAVRVVKYNTGRTEYYEGNRAMSTDQDWQRNAVLVKSVDAQGAKFTYYQGRLVSLMEGEAVQSSA